MSGVAQFTVVTKPATRFLPPITWRLLGEDLAGGWLAGRPILANGTDIQFPYSPAVGRNDDRLARRINCYIVNKSDW